MKIKKVSSNCSEWQDPVDPRPLLEIKMDKALEGRL